MRGANLKGFAVWLPMMAEDSFHAAELEAKNFEGLPVAHMWDPEHQLGELYTKVLKLRSTAWDVYFLYPPGLGDRAQVVVAELVPAVVKWNRELLTDLAGSPLDDNRVTLHEADVAQMIKTAKGDYNAILLDVDNGPHALTRKDNDWLYSPIGLNTAFAALRPKGVLAIWSSGPDPAFAQRLRKAGFEVDEVRVRARGGGIRKGGAHYIVWTAMRI